MKIPTRPVLVMHGSRSLLGRIRAAAAGRYTVRAFHDWNALAEAIPDAPPSALVVVDPYAHAAAPGTVSRAVYALLSDFPSIPVLAAVEFVPERTDDLVRLARAGVVEVIAVGHDDTPQALLARFRRSEGQPLKALLDRALPETGVRTQAMLDAAAAVVSTRGRRARPGPRSRALAPDTPVLGGARGAPGPAPAPRVDADSARGRAAR